MAKEKTTDELTSEDKQKIRTILEQLSQTNLVSPAVYATEIQPLIVKLGNNV